MNQNKRPTGRSFDSGESLYFFFLKRKEGNIFLRGQLQKEVLICRQFFEFKVKWLFRSRVVEPMFLTSMSVSASPMLSGITKIMSALLRRKWLLCRELTPVRGLMCGRRTGIPSGLAPGAQSFRTGSPSSVGFHPFRLGWIGGESFPPTFIWFWKADT